MVTKGTEVITKAFRQCTCLTEITLPPNLTAIGVKPFNGCTSLTEITLPPNLTS